MSAPRLDFASKPARRRFVVLVVVVLTVGAGVGAAGIDAGLGVAGFDVESESADDLEYVNERFVTDDRPVTIVVVQGEDVLTKESLSETMELQSSIRENDTVAPTLSDERPTADTGTVFVETYLRSIGSFGDLTLEDKRRTFRTFSDDELEAELPGTLDDDAPVLGPGTSASTLLPADHDGSASADARLVLVVHDEDVDDEALLESQLAIEALAEEHVDSETFVFGEALVEQRSSEATIEAFAVLGPLAFVLVVGLLLMVYRDPLDVLLSLTGIGIVFVWTAGFVGWSGIEPTQLLVAVPWLLLGLSVDYGFHVVMRYREARTDGVADPGRAMTAALGGVLVAIGATTATTAAGFLTGVVGPDAIRDFGTVAAVGITSAFVVFGAFVPALEVEFDELLDRERHTGPIGRTRIVERVVALGVAGAARAPVTVVAIALVLAVGGAVGAAHVDTSVDRTDFYPGDSPDWASSVPGIESDGANETLHEQATFLEERFEMVGGGDHVTFLIRGSVTNESGVRAVHTVEREAVATGMVRGDDGPDAVYTPFDVVDRFAEYDQRIADELEQAELDSPHERDVTGVFDATYEIGGDAMDTVVYRDETGEYRAVRVVVPVERSADERTVASEMRAVADRADEEPGVSVSATGGPIVTADAQAALLKTLVESFALALGVSLLLLIVLFRLRYGSLLVGVTTVVPVVMALSWVLGTMYLVGLPYNAETAIITGIAIGLGIDYAIHVSSRFEQEYDPDGRPAGSTADPTEALSRTVRDTGGTLFASALTTVAALGVLLFTFVPSLQRFGVVMVLVVVYAFVASVFVLPSLLVLGVRWREDADR